MIEVRNLTKKYGDQVAVDNLSFTVEDGQIYGFLGPNGAGKSTTMNIMTGYLGATSGQVIINGHDILEEPEEAKACIGYLPELPPLYTDMTVIGYLNFCAELKKIPRRGRREAVEEAMEKTGTDAVQDRLIKNLSKGYRQRVGLAQAVLGMPPIIILDEPTVGLDPKQIIEIRELIRQMSKDHTVILSSHIMQEISAVCSYILIISHGKLVASDTAENLMNEQTRGSLDLTVRGESREVEEILASVPEVVSVQMQESSEKGAVQAVVTAAAGCDVREDVFYALAEARCPLLAMNPENGNLEELFLELTEAGDPAEEGSEEEDSAEEAAAEDMDEEEEGGDRS